MRKGTISELDVATQILRRIELNDPELNIFVHDVARRIEVLRPLLRNGEPITTELRVKFQDDDEAFSSGPLDRKRA